MAIDIARLRRQNREPIIPDMSGGSMDMGVINYDLDEQQYGEPPPEYYEDPNEQQYPSPTMDPRQPVNPSIAPPVGGPGSRGQQTAENLMDIIDRIYTPETTSRDRFNRLLDAAPEREGPGVMRGLAAFGMGLGAKDPLDTLKVHEQVLFAPHHRNMADWTAKTQPFGQAAQFENTANINERTLAGNIATNVTNQQRYDQQNAINEEKNRIAEFRAESDRIRQEAYRFKQMNPEWEIDTTGPRILAIAPDGSGRKIDLGDSGKMTQADLENLRGKYRVEAMAAQGQNAANVAGIRGITQWRDSKTGAIYNLDPSQARNATTMGLTPVTPGASPFPQGQLDPIDPTPPRAPVVTPQAQRFERNQKFIQFNDARPDLGQKWLIPPVVSTGDWQMRPPPPFETGSLWWKGPNPALVEYNQVREALGLPPINPPQPQPQQQAPAPQAQPRGLGPSNIPAMPNEFGGLPMTSQDEIPLVRGGRQTDISLGVPNEQGPPPIDVPPNAPFTLEQIRAMPYDELRQRAIGYLMTNNIEVNETTIQIAITKGRLAANQRMR